MRRPRGLLKAVLPASLLRGLHHDPCVYRQYPPRPLSVDQPAASPPDNPPRIALVTPCYNHAAYIASTIESVLGQGYPNLCYAVHDGGSTDGSAAIIASYADRLADQRSEPDRGQADAINRAFAHTEGEIMAWLNSDDLLLPGTLAYVASFFRANPWCDVLYGHRVIIDERGLEVGRWALPAHSRAAFVHSDLVPQETLFWRRSIWERAGGRVDPGFQFALDWDLLLRFERVGARFHRADRFLGAFRTHERQKSIAERSGRGAEEIGRLRRARLRGPAHALWWRARTRVYCARMAMRTARLSPDPVAGSSEARIDAVHRAASRAPVSTPGGPAAGPPESGSSATGVGPANASQRVVVRGGTTPAGRGR